MTTTEEEGCAAKEFALHALRNRADELEKLVKKFGPNVALHRFVLDSAETHFANGSEDDDDDVERGVDEDGSGSTPLHLTCAACSLEAAEFLIETTTVDLTQRSQHGLLALHSLLVHFCCAAGASSYDDAYRYGESGNWRLYLEANVDGVFAASRLVPFGGEWPEKKEEKRRAFFFSPSQERIASTIELYLRRLPLGFFELANDRRQDVSLCFGNNKVPGSLLEPMLNHVVRCDATPSGWLTRLFVEEYACDPTQPAILAGKHNESTNTKEQQEGEMFPPQFGDPTCAYGVARICVQRNMSLFEGSFTFLSEWGVERLLNESERYQPF